MSFIARVYVNDRIYSIDFSEVQSATIGSDQSDTVSLTADGLTKNHVSFVKSQGGFIIKSKNLLTMEDSPISSNNISVDDGYVLDTWPSIAISIHPKQNDSNQAVNLHILSEINIGRVQTNDIVLANMRTSSKHCKIFKVGSIYRIKDLDSKNGTFVNGRKVHEKVLNDNDVINLSIYQIVFADDALSFYNTGNDMTLNVEHTEKSKVERKEKTEEPKKKGTVSVFDLA